MNGINDDIFIIFVAVNRDPSVHKHYTNAWIEDGNSYLYIVLPYQELLGIQDSKLFMKKYLIENIKLLNWLDYEAIQKKVEQQLLFEN